MPFRLLILRHAAAAPPGAGGRDFDRPLTTAGAQRLAAVTAALRGVKCTVALCSPARRTRDTAAIVMEAFTPRPVLQMEDRLYNAEIEAVFDVLREAAATAAGPHPTILLVGHNPSVTELAQLLLPPARVSAETPLHPGKLVDIPRVDL